MGASVPLQGVPLQVEGSVPCTRFGPRPAWAIAAGSTITATTARNVVALSCRGYSEPRLPLGTATVASMGQCGGTPLTLVAPHPDPWTSTEARAAKRGTSRFNILMALIDGTSRCCVRRTDGV